MLVDMSRSQSDPLAAQLKKSQDFSGEAVDER